MASSPERKARRKLKLLKDKKLKNRNSIARSFKDPEFRQQRLTSSKEYKRLRKQDLNELE